MKNSEKDLQIRKFEQEAQSDKDLESMVPPLWSSSTYSIVISILFVVALILIAALAI